MPCVPCFLRLCNCLCSHVTFSMSVWCLSSIICARQSHLRLSDYCLQYCNDSDVIVMLQLQCLVSCTDSGASGASPSHERAIDKRRLLAALIFVATKMSQQDSSLAVRYIPQIHYLSRRLSMCYNRCITMQHWKTHYA